jgi:uncharacterized delta-60 repeat protein
MFSNCYIRGFVFAKLLFLVIAFSVAAIAQSGSVDLTFNAVPTNPLPTDSTFQQIVQPDGKIIVYNAPSMFVNGELRSGMFRLNTDGSTDTTFAYNNEGGVGINNIMLAPDGKIVVAGTASPNHAKMIRLNSDGSVDNSFSVFIGASGPPEFTGNVFILNAILPDGRVIATHKSWGNIQGTWYSYSMNRYTANGSSDFGFVSPNLEGGHLVTTSALIEQIPDGRFYLSITSRSHLGGFINISRRFGDGTVDPTYTAYSATFSSSGFLSIEDLSAASDGDLLAAGVFVQTAPGFPPQQQLRRFLPNGSPTPGFSSPLVFLASRVHQLPDGKILYSAAGGTASSALMRLEANGSVDSTYVLDPVVTSIRNTWQVGPMNQPVFLAVTAAGPRLVRLLADGAIDPNFNVHLAVQGSASQVAVQSDGKVIVAGSFLAMNGVARGRIARLNADGSLDTTFDPGTGFSNFGPNQLLIQPDGKIVAVGAFTNYNGTPVTRAVRINTDGSIDSTFSVNIPGSAGLDCVALQPDGKILIGGGFSTVNGISRTGVARLTSTGELDTSFDSVLAAPVNVFQIKLEPDGKIMVGGLFAVNGISRNNVVRLQSDGAVDPTFDAGPNAGSGFTVRTIDRQPDGKYVVTEGSDGRLLRRNNDGSLDATFTPPVFTLNNSSTGISSVFLLPQGGMLVSGAFDSVSGVPRSLLTRLRSNGTHDPSFMPNGASSTVRSFALYPEGKVMIAGQFTSVDNVPRLGVARINVPAFQRRTPFDFDGDGRADISVLRSSTNRWYELLSQTGAVVEETFGLAGDILAPADFDGDGITDEGIFRPSNGQWWYHSSVNGALVLNPFGGLGDIPRPSDFDGDGKADLVLFRPSTNTWFRFGSVSNHEVTPVVFGLSGDQPLVGDFDGDGKSDLAIFRPSNGDWWYAASSAGGAFRNVHWGQYGDIPVPADYDGDGKTDYAVYRPSQGGWYIYNSSNGSFTTTAFGISTDRPVAADYDGDGKADIAVFRPSTGIWYLLRSTSGFAGYQFGISTDTAIPGSLIP